MRIVQVLIPTATAFEQKCQRADFEALSPQHEVVVVTSASEAGSGGLAHFYGPRKQTIARIGARKRWFSRRPTVAISPLAEPGFVLVQEPVEKRYFEDDAGRRRPEGPATLSVGVLRRPAIQDIVELTIARVHRTRDDIDFLLFDEMPAPHELRDVDLWLDPAIDDHDFDGCVAEAIVCGLPVVGSRTPINAQRLENGRAGFLAPRNDPNELTHAILSALFKPEVAQQKVDGARQTRSKYRSRQRLRALVPVYRSLLS